VIWISLALFLHPPRIMPFREFVDAAGVEWSVWEVQPSLLERRSGEVVIQADGERRGTPIRRAPVAMELRFGWLVFESESAKRRLAPIPPGWESADEQTLRGYLHQATIRDGPRLAILGKDSRPEARA
jgi:hypothetical protein